MYASGLGFCEYKSRGAIALWYQFAFATVTVPEEIKNGEDCFANVLFWSGDSENAKICVLNDLKSFRPFFSGGL